MIGISHDVIGDRQAPFPVLPEAVRRSRVLVVDDNPANVLLLQRLLQAAGLEYVEGYTDPRTGLERCVEAVPDLLLLDLHMPPPNGFEVMEQLQATRSAHPVTILVLSADSTQMPAVFEGGADSFLGKPFRLPDVVERVQLMLKKPHSTPADEEPEARTHEESTPPESGTCTS